jgi:hypothetical protein
MRKIYQFIFGVFFLASFVFLFGCGGGGGGNNGFIFQNQSAVPKITTFNFSNASASTSIDDIAHTVTVTVPRGTDLTNLVPIISISSGGTFSPASGVPQNFTNPVVYTVTGSNRETQKYTVTVKVSQDSLVVFSDDFSSGALVNSENWHIPTWVSSTDGTFVGRTQFRCSQNAPLPSIVGGSAEIGLDTYNPTGASFYGTDLLSNKIFSLGNGLIITVRAKMNGTPPAGIVGGIFLYAPPALKFSGTLHDEIDFELLTNDPANVHTNIYGNESLGVGHPEKHSFVSGSISTYHDYQIQWLPGEVAWYVDGKLVRKVTTGSPLPKGPMYLHLNMWVPASDFVAAYSPSLLWTTIAGLDQRFSMSVDSVTIISK